MKDPRVVELCYWQEGHEAPVVIRCKPTKLIEIEAMVIHGITNEDVEWLPLFQELPEYEEIKELIENSIVIAHNVDFDILVLKNEGIKVDQRMDTKEMARLKWPEAPKHRLQYLRYWLNLNVVGGGAPHTALGDVQTLRALWEELLIGRPKADTNTE